ncbi:hypothetical protein GMC85_01785 [Streptococcus parasanguinis]|uniref:DUF6287 domain-containing protein n=2 Tax=Streptococcus parasanguinis TaxID=1318 RepID=E3CEU9_STRPA|nr:DUF6287 domain-containing protein [Streptococcus parasanguinis]EFQ54742.1 hypothetical protein HMPREF9626_1666 [Streptococcus parasanguinis F0405]MTR54145.1 hypothetical protein [Streptococcus parasanguinis]MTR56085.1 hypothetical protein [Streptococcus parasanguinis]MTR60717.1 hypothetical protein [Streptococcus parasanguinis]MTR62792.1 hypothetical protein [Streptococcus parasanguinis]
MKKVGAILVSFLSVLLLVACSQQSASKKSDSSSSQTSASSEVKKTTASSSEVKEKEKKEEKKMDLEAIANGDYSSIAGVWQDDKGNKLVFNDKGLVSQELEGYGASLTDYGTASEGIYGGRDGGFLLEYIPAGVTIGDQVDDQGQVVFKDTSDASKNRLWSGVGIASFGEQGSIYYHVGDE